MIRCPRLLLAGNYMILLIGSECKSNDRTQPDTVSPVSDSHASGIPPASWAHSATPVGPPVSAVPRVGDLVYAGVVTGAWSGLLSLLVYGIGRLLGVPFETRAPFSDGEAVVPWFVVLLVPLIAGVGGALLSTLALGRPHARRIVFWAGTAIALVTVASPLIQPVDVLWSSRIWLLLPHVITWFLVVPQLARIVGDSEPGAFVPDQEDLGAPSR